MSILRSAILTLSVCSPLGAQSVGVGYQVARSDQQDTREASGPGLRIRFTGPIDLRYDYLAAGGQRFDTPCVGLILPGPDCAHQTIDYSSDLHSVFIAGRARLLSKGSLQLFLLPELGLISGTIKKRGTSNGRTASATGSALGGGAALELAAPRVAGKSIGGWFAIRGRGFMHPGESAADGYQPHRYLNWISSAELGLTVAVQLR